MSLYFLDTSAVAKRYIPETGTTWVSTLTDTNAGNVIIISDLATVEFMALVARRQRENSIPLATVVQLSRDFASHVRYEYQVIPLNRRLLNRAKGLVLKHPIRTLDAIQLASAIVAAQTLNVRPTFITGDQRLLTAAAAEGFPTDNPYNHP